MPRQLEEFTACELDKDYYEAGKEKINQSSKAIKFILVMNEIQQEIPQAPEIETAVLGALLTDNNCIPENIDKIQIEFFVNPVNQIIFSAIKEMYLLGKDVDILTLTIYLKNKNRLNEVGGAPFISDLTNGVTSSLNIESWILILHETQIRRNLLKMAQKNNG